MNYLPPNSSIVAFKSVYGPRTNQSYRQAREILIIDLGTFMDFEQNKIRDRIGRIFGINWMESTNFAELHDQIPIWYWLHVIEWQYRTWVRAAKSQPTLLDQRIVQVQLIQISSLGDLYIPNSE